MSRQQKSLLLLFGFSTIIFVLAAFYTYLGNPFPQNTPLSPMTLPLGEDPQALRLIVHQTGLMAISARDIRRTDLPFQTFSTDSLRLTRDGQDIPFYLAGRGDNATLYFYAQAITNTMASPAVYWLSPEPGLAMTQQTNTVTAETGDNNGLREIHWEENSIFLAQANGHDSWLGELLYAPASQTIELKNIQANGGPGHLTLRLWSNNQASTNPDHHIKVFFNDVPVGDEFWDGITEITISLPIEAGLITPGTNKVTINVPGDTGAAGEAIYLDWATLSYESLLESGDEQMHFTSQAETIEVRGEVEAAMVFDITEPTNPSLIANVNQTDDKLLFGGNGNPSNYLVVTPDQLMKPQITPVPRWEPLQNPERGADYIAIVANIDGFMDTLQPLLALRREQGLQVEAIIVDQIYDEFAYGRHTPEAIRDFLLYASTEWQEPSPRFVLLVGDATYDLYDFSGGKNKNILPTYMIYTEFAGYVASDTWYTIFDPESLESQLAIGRFPVQTVNDLEKIVAKTIAYEEANGAWLNQALLVADDEERFNLASDELNDDLSQVGYTTQKLYMTENDNIHDDIISALNQGVGIVNYVGHGSVEVWGDEMVLQVQDAAILKNEQRLPIFTTFTCLNGYFNHPQSDALAEMLLLAPNGGIVAAIAPSGRTFTAQQTPIADSFYGYLLSSDNQTIGEALQWAKLDAAHDPYLKEVIYTFNLLGDPALRFQTP